MFKFRDNDVNIIKDHPLFTEENLKKMKELGIDPENLSDNRIFDEVNPLINKDITKNYKDVELDFHLNKCMVDGVYLLQMVL